MITKQEAVKKIEKILKIETEIEIIILDGEIIEKEFGWVFFYQSKKYLETEDFNDILCGNAPYIVNRFDGSIHCTGTANNISYYIEEYEKILSIITADNTV